jgi:methanogenic corrinoid protein MtbC1
MDPERISRALLALRAAVSEDVVARSEPLRAMGERGVRFCDEDAQHHLENLATAVALGTATLFEAYAAWARDVLAARALPTDCLTLALQAIRDRLPEAELPDDARRTAVEAVELALRVAGGPPEPSPARTESDGFRLSVAGERRALLDLVCGWQDEAGVSFALRQLARVQDEVGEAWLRNEISVAQEHRATGLAQLALSLLAPHTAGAPGPRPRGRAVVACAEGDWHAVGPRIAADLLELEGYEVEYLGANTPASELLRACRAVQPVLVGIGVAPLAALPAARAAAEAIRQELPATRLVAGGSAARLAGAAPLAADWVAPADFDGKLP